MNSTARSLLSVVALSLLPLTHADAQVVTYTDEAAYLAALTAQNFPVVHEGFEDDAVWGGLRSSIVGGAMLAPSVNNLGITWMGNTSISQITTGFGAAISASWGFYQFPHGDIPNSIPDGIKGTGDTSLVAIGGWMDTPTPYAGISLYLDGVEAGFQGSSALGLQSRFFGAINPAGFSQFEFRETEAMPGDWKLIFTDDYYFAFGGTLIDCNANGVGDSLDILNGTSTDCNLTGVPDECEIDVGSSAPGGPFFCQSGCATDCNDNGVPDTCELVQPITFSSGQLGPIGNGSPQSFTLLSTPTPFAQVLVDFSAYANLAGPDEYIDVQLNGTFVGTIFVGDGDDCPEPDLSETLLIIPKQLYINLVGSGSALFELVASVEVDTNDCDFPSHIEAVVTIFTPSALDGNQNGVIDSCETGSFASICNGDGGDQLGCTDCPCSNNALTGTKGGCLNSAGNSTSIAASGDPSASSPPNVTTDLRFTLVGAPSNAFCVMLSGSAVAPQNSANACFGLSSGVKSSDRDGLRCAVINIKRHGGRSADMMGEVMDGSGPSRVWGGEAQPNGGLWKQGGFAAGQTRYFQVTYRENPLLSCMRGLNTSQAIEVTFTP